MTWNWLLIYFSNCALWKWYFYCNGLCSIFIWITNSYDHRRVWTANLLHTKLLPNPLGLKAQFETWLEVEVSQDIFTIIDEMFLLRSTKMLKNLRKILKIHFKLLLLEKYFIFKGCWQLKLNITAVVLPCKINIESNF